MSMDISDPKRKKSLLVAASMLVGGAIAIPSALPTAAALAALGGFSIGIGVAMIIYQFGPIPANEVK